jgi:hypothetical protein
MDEFEAGKREAAFEVLAKVVGKEEVTKADIKLVPSEYAYLLPLFEEYIV